MLRSSSLIGQLEIKYFSTTKAYSMKEFFVPVHPEDLENPGRDDRLSLENITKFDKNQSYVAESINRIDVELSKSNGAKEISQDSFDVLYSLNKAIKKMPGDDAGDFVRALSSITNAFAVSLRKEIASVAESPVSMRNRLKIHVFMNMWALEQIDGMDSLCKSTNVAGDLISSVADVLEIDGVEKLWQFGKIEEEFLYFLVQFSMKLFRSPQNTPSKRKGHAEALYHLIGLFSKKFNSLVLPLTTALIDAIYKHEHAAQATAQLLAYTSTELHSTELATEIIREFGRMRIESHSKDMKGLGVFLSSFAERQPTIFLENISVLVHLLKHVSYTLRNGVIHSIGVLLIWMKGTENLRDTSKTLLDLIVEHFRDVNAYTRGKTCTVFNENVIERALPLDFYHVVTARCVERLHDKSSIVRKSATVLLTSLVENNPYSSMLSLPYFEKQLRDASAMVTERLRRSRSERPKAEADADADGADTAEDEEEEALLALMEKFTVGDDGGADQGDDGESEEVKEVRKLWSQMNFLSDAIHFLKLLEAAFPVLSDTLVADASSATEINAVIRFFVVARKFQLSDHLSGIYKMLELYFSLSRGGKVAPAASQVAGGTATDNCTEIVNAFRTLYFSDEDDENAWKDNLITLLGGMNAAEKASFRKLLANILQSPAPKSTKSGKAGKQGSGIGTKRKQAFLSALWRNRTAETFELLSMAADGCPNVVADILQISSDENMAGIAKTVEIYAERPLEEVKVENLRLLRHLCEIITATTSATGATPVNTPVDTAGGAVGGGPSQAQAERMTAAMGRFMLREKIQGCDSGTFQEYLTVTAAMVASVYALERRHSPVKHLRAILLELPTTAGNARDLQRFLTLSSLVALQQLIHQDALLRDFSVWRKCKKQAKADASGEAAATASAEEEYALELEAAERDILTQDSLLGIAGELASHVCTDSVSQGSGQGSDQGSSVPLGTRRCAALALCRFMAVNEVFCGRNLRLLFTLIAKDSDATVRSNAIIAVGDLISRYPNSLEPWMAHIYAALDDSVLQVRKSVIHVLTHVILRDMVKVRSHIGNIARCLLDKDSYVSAVVKFLFSELAKRENVLFNVMPDIISNLISANEADGKSTSTADFKAIASFLFELLNKVSKLRQSEGMQEKLLLRFKSCPQEKWHLVSHCLTLLPPGEKFLKKLLEKLPTMKAVLTHDEVFKDFMSILANARRDSKENAELKELLNEIEAKIEDARSATSSLDASADAGMAAVVAPTRTTGRRKKAAPAKRAPARRSARKTAVRYVESDGSSDDDSDSLVYDDEDSFEVPLLEELETLET